MVDIKNLEMVTCPICGKPFPKKRQELGYNYCVNCSSESKVAALIEGTMDGEDCQTSIQIISRAEAEAIDNALRFGRRVIVDSEYEEAPNTMTFEEQDEELVENHDTSVYVEDRYTDISDEDLALLSQKEDDEDDDFSERDE